MAVIQLYTDKPRYVFGWYGTCGSSTNFDLNTIKQYLVGVYQINEEETSWDLYNPNLPEGLQQDFVSLEPGFMYLLVFKATTGNVSVVIEDLETTNISNQSSKRVSDTCEMSACEAHCDVIDDLTEQVSKISDTLSTLKDSCDRTPTPVNQEEEQTPTPTKERTPTPIPQDEQTPTPTKERTPTPIAQDEQTPTPKDCGDETKTCHDGTVVGKDNNCEFEDCPDLEGCKDETKKCADGSYVGRDPNNGCDWMPCPPDDGDDDDDTEECNDDVKKCADGTYVVRNPNNCDEFLPCPNDDIDDPDPDDPDVDDPDDKECKQGTLRCADGTFVERDPNDECRFVPCPDDNKCNDDIKVCKDGSFVSRDPSDCSKFLPCDDDCSDTTTQDCGEGVFVGKDPSDCDNFLPCPDLQLTPTPINQDNLTPTPTPDPDATPTPTDKLETCDEREKVCSDGSIVTRDIFNGCEFPPCGDDFKCNDDLLLCPNGQYVGRDPTTCDFLPCPGVIENCDKGYKKCEDGIYVIADANDNCNYVPCPNDNDCADLTLTCSDGTVVVPNPKYGCEFDFCPPENDRCNDQVKLCPDGNYVGRDPNNGCNFYPCEGTGDCEDHSLLCPDGSYVSRDPNNGCDFIPCPGEPWECEQGRMECEDGVYVSKDPDAECEYVPCPGTTRPDDPDGEDKDCPTEAAPDYVRCCVEGITPSEMNGTYEGPVPCDHDPFQYCYYHVNSPVDSNGNRKWFILANISQKRYSLKTLDNPTSDIVSSKRTNISPCTPVQKGTYPFCVDWTGTGITASDCSYPEEEPTPISQTTPTPTTYSPPIPGEPVGPTGPGTPTGPGGDGPGGDGPGGGTSGPTGGGGGTGVSGPWGRGGPGGGWGDIFRGRHRPGGRRGWPWNPRGGRRRPGGGYSRRGWWRRRGGGGRCYPGRRGRPGGGWTFPKPGGGSIYCARGGSLLVRNIFNRNKRFRVYPVYGVRIGDLVRISIDGGIDCYQVYDSACVTPQCYIVPNSCKQHCSSLPPVDCNSCDNVLPYKSSAFNFVDRSPVIVPDTKEHSFYDFTGKEYPGVVCVSGFDGCYQVYSGSHAWDCYWDGENFNGSYYFLNPITGKDILGRTLKKTALGHNILGAMYRNRYFSAKMGGGQWKPMWIHERFFDRKNNFYSNGRWRSRYMGLLFPVYPDFQNENDTNGRWVIQFNQYTSGSISAYSQKASDAEGEWIMKPHEADWHPHGGHVEVCSGPVVLEDSEPWPPVGPRKPYDNSCKHGYACKVVPYNSSNSSMNEVSGLVAWESGLRVHDVIRISADEGYGCWRIVQILCAETEHYVLNKSPNCRPGYPDDIGGPYDDDEEVDIGECETCEDHCRGVELYAPDAFEPKEVSVQNLDYDEEATLTADNLEVDGDEFSSHISADTDGVVISATDREYDQCELQLRWSNEIGGKIYLQGRCITRPTDIDRFGERDMTKWSTLYGLEGQSEDGFDLNHASWPVASVASDYEFEKTFDFGGMTFTLEDTHSKGYLQLYVQIPSGSNGDWSHTMSNPTSKKALFLYFGDNENPTYLANGVSAMWPVIEFVPNTPTPLSQNEVETHETPSTISPSMWTDDEMLAQFNSSASPKYCAISMYAKDGKYYIASGTNKVGEPQSFEKAPIINWNLCDECVNQDHTHVFLSINVYENEEAANLACVDDSNGICSRPHINPMSYSHPLQLSLTSDGTHNGGTALEPLNTGNSSVNATAQSFYIRITADTEKITEPTKVYYYCEEHPNMGGILNILPCESTPTPTPIPQQSGASTGSTDSSQSSSSSELNCVDIRNNIDDMVSDEVCCYYGVTHKTGVGPIDQRCKIVAPTGGMDTYTPTLDYTTHDYTTNSYLNETGKSTESGNLKLCDTANLELKYVDYGEQTINLNKSGSDQEVRSIFGYSLKIKHSGYSSNCTAVPFFVEAVNNTTGEIFEIGEYTYKHQSFNYANNSVPYFSGNTNGKKYIETSAGAGGDVELIIPADPVGITLYVTLCDMDLSC